MHKKHENLKIFNVIILLLIRILSVILYLFAYNYITYISQNLYFYLYLITITCFKHSDASKREYFRSMILNSLIMAIFIPYIQNIVKIYKLLFLMLQVVYITSGVTHDIVRRSISLKTRRKNENILLEESMFIIKLKNHDNLTTGKIGNICGIIGIILTSTTLNKISERTYLIHLGLSIYFLLPSLFIHLK